MAQPLSPGSKPGRGAYYLSNAGASYMSHAGDLYHLVAHVRSAAAALAAATLAVSSLAASASPEERVSIRINIIL